MTLWREGHPHKPHKTEEGMQYSAAEAGKGIRRLQSGNALTTVLSEQKTPATQSRELPKYLVRQDSPMHQVAGNSHGLFPDNSNTNPGRTRN